MARSGRGKRRREEDEDDEDEPSRAQARAESESDDEAGRESDSEGDERSDDSSGESDEEEEGLFVACQEGSLDDLKAMEEAGALEVNRRDREEGDTPISVACRWGHLPVAEWLHSRGAALDSPNGAGEAPIHEAAIHGSPELIAWLLSALGPAAASEIERCAEGGLTPLGFACLRGNTEAAKALLEAGASAAAVDERGHTLLHLAASNGRNETAAVALEAMEAVQAREAGGGGGGGGGGEGGGGGGGGDDEAEAERLVDVRDGLGRTPLMLAAGEGRLEAVEWLVGRGASVDSADGGGVRPLHYASAYGDAATALWLIEHGAAVGEASDAGNLPLHHAAQAGAVALAERLLRGDGGAGGAGARNGDGDTPMLLACFGGHVELCELLAARGEPVDSVNGDGCSGLVQACAAGHLPLVQWLLPRAPGLLEMADGRGATPLVYACEQGHAEIAEWLLEQGAAPGDEAAQAAAEAGLADLAKKLKAAKAAAAAAGGE